MALAAGVAGMAAGTAVAVRPAGSRAEAGLLLAALLLVAVVGVLLTVVDLAVLRLPDVLVLPTASTVAAILAVAAAVTGQPGRLLGAAGAAFALGTAYALIAVSPGSALGFGDVKLATVLGAPLGWLGWPTALLGAVLPVVLGGLVAVGLLAVGRIRRDTPIPFGPALVAGFLLAILLPPSTLE